MVLTGFSGKHIVMKQHAACTLDYLQNNDIRVKLPDDIIPVVAGYIAVNYNNFAECKVKILCKRIGKRITEQDHSAAVACMGRIVYDSPGLVLLGPQNSGTKIRKRI